MQEKQRKPVLQLLCYRVLIVARHETLVARIIAMTFKVCSVFKT